MFKFNIHYLALAAFVFVLEVLIAAFLHDDLIRGNGGDFLVVIFLYCLTKSFLNTPVPGTCLGVLVFAYTVEISQYFHLINILRLQHSIAARLVLGTTFAWADMLAYTLGILLVVITERLTPRKHKN